MRNDGSGSGVGFGFGFWGKGPNFVSEKLRRSLLQKFITVQMLPVLVNRAAERGSEGTTGRKDERKGAGNAFKSSLSFELFNYKVRKMFAYFSAVCDTDEEQKSR